MDATQLIEHSRQFSDLEIRFQKVTHQAFAASGGDTRKTAEKMMDLVLEEFSEKEIRQLIDMTKFHVGAANERIQGLVASLKQKQREKGKQKEVAPYETQKEAVQAEGEFVKQQITKLVDLILLIPHKGDTAEPDEKGAEDAVNSLSTRNILQGLSALDALGVIRMTLQLALISRTDVAQVNQQIKEEQAKKYAKIGYPDWTDEPSRNSRMN